MSKKYQKRLILLAVISVVILSLFSKTFAAEVDRLELLKLEVSKKKLEQLQETLSKDYQKYRELKEKEQQGEDVKNQLSLILENIVGNLEELKTVIEAITHEDTRNSLQDFISKLNTLLEHSEEIKNRRQPLVLEEFLDDFSRILLSLSVVEAKSPLDKYNLTYQQVIKKLESLTPGDTIDVRIGTEKDMYKEGEPLEVRFLASKDSYIILMAISTDGSLLFLAPSHYIQDTKIEGGKVYSTGLLSPSSADAVYDFGMKMRVAPPQGIEVINLFCSTEKIELFEVDFETEPIYEIRPDDEERLKALFDSLDQFENTEWSARSVQIFINTRPR